MNWGNYFFLFLSQFLFFSSLKKHFYMLYSFLLFSPQKVNDMEMNGVTREEAVLFLLSLQDQIELVVQHKREEYDQVVASGHGDSFYVK